MVEILIYVKVKWFFLRSILVLIQDSVDSNNMNNGPEKLACLLVQESTMIILFITI